MPDWTPRPRPDRTPAAWVSRPTAPRSPASKLQRTSDGGLDSRGRRFFTPGFILGLGLGGFVDGILLHQIAHWHNMGSAKLPPVTLEALRTNMRWDGWFHAAVWLLTLLGVYRLLGDARSGRELPDARRLTGQMLAGWGAFNLVEGLVDHHLLHLHHVRDLPIHLPVYDWAFLLISGVGFLLLGRRLSAA